MTPTPPSTRRGDYRTTSGYQMDDRRLRLRGGALDGRSWVGVVKVGQRVFCGEGAWSAAELYLVTAEVTQDDEGRPENIAIPAI